MIWMFGKAVIVGLGGMAVAKWWSGLGASVPDNVNVVLNFASLGVLVLGLWFAPRAFRAKAAEALLAERDTIISGHKQLLELREEEAHAAKDKSAELGGMLDEMRTTAAAWEARYAEQSKYTAQPALETIQKLLKSNNEEAERRHTELLFALRALGSKRFQVEEG